MWAALLNALFGCTHRNMTFPISLRAGKPPRTVGHFETYVVCLDCGREFPYSWDEMRILPDVDRPVAVPARAGSFLMLK